MTKPEQPESRDPGPIEDQETLPLSKEGKASTSTGKSSIPDGTLPRQLGRYAIRKELGRGGMGRVYLARDATLERDIALKVLPPEWVQRSESRARFEQEAKLLASMNHPNIATVFSLETEGKVDFITMEFVEGRTLASRLAAGPLSLDEALPILRQIAKALEAAHKRDIIHRDLKPQNIMVTSDENVKVLDFGLAWSMSGKAGGAAPDGGGTPGYMSPEQLRGGALDPRTDIWAFGCILYESVGGRAVFEGKTPADLMAASLKESPNLKRLPGEVPKRLRALIEKCLNHEMEHRPGTMLEVRQEIEEAIEQCKLRDDLLGGEEEGDTGKHNLSRALTPFVGRAKELDELRRLIKGQRLITLVGSGGSGKSRLALEFAWELLGSYKDGTWFVSLASLSDPALVPQSAAEVLSVNEEPNRSLLETLADALSGKNMLLILDNCEHLIEACGQLAETVLGASERMTILATSREPLHLTAERVYPIPTLPLPPDEEAPNPRQLAEIESVQLFLQRGRAADPSFVLTARNASAVAQICRQLDGIPLALELAAARIRALPAEEIASRLDQRFRILGRSAASSQPQHQTLETLFQWSYDHLTEAEKAVFRRLSVFQGGWTLDAMEPVCADEAVPEWEVLDLFLRLADQSLLERVVQASKETEKTRYRMLQTVQSYARERLREASEETAMLHRHRDHFLAFAEEAELKGPQKAAWLSRLGDEHDNLRAALDTCARDEKDPEDGFRLIAAIGQYWFVRDHYTEGRAACRRQLALHPGGVKTKARSRVHSASGLFAWRQGDYDEARQQHEASLSILRELGEQRGVAMSLNNLGILAYEQGDIERAQELQEESLVIRRELGEQRGIAMSLGNLGNIAVEREDYPRAAGLYEESLSITRDLGDTFFTSVALHNLGILAYERTEYDRAREHHEKEREICRTLGHRSGVVSALHHLGLVARRENHLEEALSLHLETLRMIVEMKDVGGLTESLERIGILAGDAQDPVKAVHLVGAAAALRERESLVNTEPSFMVTEVEKEIALLRSKLGDEAFEREWSYGRALSSADAVECALGMAKGDS